MKKLTVCFLAVVFCSCVFAALPEASKNPLGKSELLGLVAGDALPENLVAAIQQWGLRFHVDAGFRSEMEKAGADSKILAALDAAKSGAPEGAKEADHETLEHIANAGKLIRDQKYSEAADELNQVAKASYLRPEIGFAIAQALRMDERFDDAAAVYGEVLRQDPDFPEAHTKLSYVLYRLGDQEAALREAKTALTVTPGNAEAHKNAGLALTELRKFDAAEAEFQAALSKKPNYQAVQMDLGILYSEKGETDRAIAAYKKAIALDPSDASARYNLGVTYQDKGDFPSAILEYREAKRLNPKRF